jgi:hypothetical protein
MFRKELADVLRQTVCFLAVVAVLPVPIILFKGAPGPYRAVLAPLLEMGLVFWSLFLGASLLGREQGQRAVEYALSLPHSRLGLLVRLAGPRLLVMLGFLLAGGIAFETGILSDSDILPAGLIVGIGLQLFFISLSLSVLIENFIVLCLVSFLSCFAAGFAVLRLMLMGYGAGAVDLNMQGLFAPGFAAFGGKASFPPILLQLILPVVPFVAALLFSFGRFDVRRSRPFKRRYGIAFAAGLAFCALAAFGGRAAAGSLGSKHFYLTQDLKLAEWRLGTKTVMIHGPGSTLEVRIGPSGSPLEWDDGSSLFVWDADDRLIRIDLATGELEPLYRSDQTIRSYLFDQKIYGSTIALVEAGSRRDEIRIVALDRQTKKADRHVFTGDAFISGWPQIIGTGLRDGMRFWICWIRKIGGRPVERATLRLWEDGRIEEILVKGRPLTVNTPHFLGGLLFFTGKEPMLVLQDTGKSFEIKKEFPADEIFNVQDESWDLRIPLDAPPFSFIYGKRGPRLARMSLETLEIEDLGAWGDDDDAWGFVKRHGDQAYFFGGSYSRKSLDVYALSEAGMRLIRSFPGVDTRRRDTRFTVYGSGVVITQGGRVGVYAFPDLRDIEYH